MCVCVSISFYFCNENICLIQKCLNCIIVFVVDIDKSLLWLVFIVNFFVFLLFDQKTHEKSTHKKNIKHIELNSTDINVMGNRVRASFRWRHFRSIFPLLDFEFEKHINFVWFIVICFLSNLLATEIQYQSEENGPEINF